MKTSSKMLFYSMTIVSTIMVLSSTSLINMWIGLEINLMSFIPMMYTNKNMYISQSMMMYFLIQSMASMLFIVFILTNKYMFITMKNENSKMLIMLTMMMKMGMPPFHMWFPEIMNKMSWPTCFMLMTWQKIAPMYITSMMIELNKTMMMMICLSALVGAIGGINQTSTRKIMAYSSINHMSWMIACAATFKKSWMIYMMMYTAMMAVMTMMMFEYNIMFMNQMNIFMKKKMNKMIITFMMLSMGGLPPFMGFIPKWITIQYMMLSNEFIMMIVMTTSALVTLSYYLKMTNTMNLIMSHSQKWMNLFNTKKSISIWLLYMNMLLPAMIILMNFY